uniref:hypothetical protein n=1 Tax=Cellvibrio fontiphilus TaxID=1815559 RepID=UPI002B4BE21D|nr:hypothetical protein [Cellvibrio fontiphilus]
MLKSVASVFALLAGAFLAVSAQANLIVNGGFEDNNVATGSWSYFSSANVNGWEGSNLEIWDSMNGVVAPEGTQHAELNAHPYTGGVFSIYQSFATVVGQTYDVSFFYSARQSANEAFSFSVGTLATLLNDHTVGVWNQFTGSFVANSALTTISFTTANNSTVGNFLDGVVVTASTKVNEASSLVLLAMGLLSLVMVRRNNRA